MTPIRRFLEWRRDLLTPDHVEKASRRERLKRGLWMFGTTIVTLIAVFGVGGVIAVQHLGPELGTIVAFASWVYVDYRVGVWGISYFDLVPPWQFRDVEQNAREER